MVKAIQIPAVCMLCFWGRLQAEGLTCRDEPSTWQVGEGAGGFQW